MSSLSTHVLDAVSGQPAVGVRVALERHAGDGWQLLGDGVTDTDGRLRDLVPDGLGAGAHRLVFGTGEYFAATGQIGFYPEVTVAFTVTEDRHHHVPLLLSPYAFSTYRGS